MTAIEKTTQTFELAQREARAMSASSLVPDAYRDNVPNVLIAMETAQRIGASPLAVMQNLHIVQGKPGFSSSFLIATVNASGRFTPLRFRWEGTTGKDDFGCRAYAADKETGEECLGALINWEMVKAEGWASKNGSKWKTMPEQMLRYRAAAFFGRLYAPEIMMGMQTAEELNDVIEVTPTVVVDDKESTTDNVRAILINKADVDAADAPAMGSAQQAVDHSTGEVYDPIPGLD